MSTSHDFSACIGKREIRIWKRPAIRPRVLTGLWVDRLFGGFSLQEFLGELAAQGGAFLG